MRVLLKILIVAACVIAAAPIAWHVLSSFKTPGELASIPPTLWPRHATLENYRELFTRRSFGRYYANSFVIATLSSLLCVSVASLAAYQIARARPLVRNIVSSGLLLVAFFPPIVLLFPLYELVRVTGLMNNPWALIPPYSALNLPLSIWLLTGYFGQIPYEIEEAAAVDGLSRLETFLKIIVPLSLPALATTGMLVFIFSWNEFMFALTFMNLESARTITVGIASLSGAFTYDVPWGLLAAGVVASSFPLILLVAVFQRRIVAGLTAGAAK